MNLHFRQLPLLLLLGGAALAPAALAQEVVLPVDPPAAAATTPAPVVGGAVMDRTATTIENLGNSSDHQRLVQALEAAGLAGALRALGPLTVFAPTDSAFSSTTYEDFDDLVKPENRGLLADLLRYHIVPGLLDTSTLDTRIEAGGGVAMLTTVLGKPLQVKRSGGQYTVTDATNHTARVTIGDVYQHNGIVHVVDMVLMPQTR